MSEGEVFKIVYLFEIVMGKWEYGHLFFGGGDMWVLYYYDREKNTIEHKEIDPSPVAALNKVAIEGWEVVSAFFVPSPEEEELPLEEYLLKRERYHK